MLRTLGCDSLQQLCEQAIPNELRRQDPLSLPRPVDEAEALREIAAIGEQNRPLRSLIGMGWHETTMPAVIRRNVLENPGWYTAYTPYQAEISQGRLAMLLNFQQLITELTGTDIANASLLDEASAAAEAMLLCRRCNRQGQAFFIDSNCHPQTIAVVRTRARWLDIPVIVADAAELPSEELFGALLQYPGSNGSLPDLDRFCTRAHQLGALAVVAADPLALVLLKPPGDAAADVVVGSTQRFGLSIAAGGPHAGYIATRMKFSRSLPGRLVGVSLDSHGREALRLSLQTREQHIRREKATSNICTAQVLPAVLSACYALHHGPDGLQQIASSVHNQCVELANTLLTRGYTLGSDHFFDTLEVSVDNPQAIMQAAVDCGYQLRLIGEHSVGISLGEGFSAADREQIAALFPQQRTAKSPGPLGIPAALRRGGPCLKHPIFSSLRSETELMRYLRRLARQDISLDQSMIALGSCTMKLNAAVEMEPISWPSFAAIHPAAPLKYRAGYQRLIGELSDMLCEITGFAAISMQPNAGSQGEYAGLLAIRRYHQARGEEQRQVCLIPSSAHGTNPASARLAGLTIDVVNCDQRGDIDIDDLRAKAEQHGDRLAAAMLTYPSTHGVFEPKVKELCRVLHERGAQVYLDGANLNAMVGLLSPAELGFDLCHLNLHKTFCIPHGGGGPGVGPLAVAEHLQPYLPADPLCAADGDAIAAAPWGSAGILPISWMYLRLMGAAGLRRATEISILNANYIATRLRSHYPLLYTGSNGRVAHECILDLRPLRKVSGITEEDVAKRLIDYGFHAPTMSFPVAGTLMIEPTESENRAEIDRFCDAMIAIRQEARDVENKTIAAADSPLRHAPHTAADVVADWERKYSREQAVFPMDRLRKEKYWPQCNRIDNIHGDRQPCCIWPSPDVRS